MTGLFLIARIAGETVAMHAADIGSVVEVDEITPVPRVAPHIAGLFALRSRVLTVVDTRAALGLGRMARAGLASAIVADHEGQSYALLVDEIEDVIEADGPEPCPALVSATWAHVARGAIRRGGEAILVIAPAGLIMGPEVLAA